MADHRVTPCKTFAKGHNMLPTKRHNKKRHMSTKGVAALSLKRHKHGESVKKQYSSHQMSLDLQISQFGKCEVKKCDHSARFNQKWHFPARCETHRRMGDVNVAIKSCLMCLDTPEFKVDGQYYCKEHTPHDLPDSSCLALNCDNHRKYGRFGVALYCFLHAFPNSKNMRKLCSVEGCMNPYKISMSKQYCTHHSGRAEDDVLKHAKNRMNIGSFGGVGAANAKARVIKFRCVRPDCFKMAVFGEEVRTHCGDHNVNGYPDQSRKCAAGCSTVATMIDRNVKGFPMYCVGHAPPQATPIFTIKCDYPCESYTKFGEFGKEGLYCAKHKTDSMINLNKKRCKHEKCTQPALASSSKKNARCAIHAK